MQEIAFEIDAQRVGRASGYLGGLTVERYTFTGATIPAGTRLAILTRAGVTIAAAEITEGNAATVDTNTQEVADLLRYQPLGACESVYIALGNADTIIALIPAVMRKNWLDDEATHPPVPANRYPTKTELGEWLARFDERATAAEAAKADAQEAAAQADQRATAAQKAKTAAESAATAAQTAQGKAEAAQAAAETAQNGAESVVGLLQEKVDAAETAQRAAQAAATSAGESAKVAGDSEQAALTAKQAAETAQGQAKASETAAKASETAAKGSETDAIASEKAAKASEQAAASSETASAESASAAKASEIAAAGSATAAKASETAAATSANEAAGSATAAGKSADAAGKSATAAANSATDLAEAVATVNSLDTRLTAAEGGISRRVLMYSDENLGVLGYKTSGVTTLDYCIVFPSTPLHAGVYVRSNYTAPFIISANGTISTVSTKKRQLVIFSVWDGARDILFLRGENGKNPPFYRLGIEWSSDGEPVIAENTAIDELPGYVATLNETDKTLGDTAFVSSTGFILTSRADILDPNTYERTGYATNFVGASKRQMDKSKGLLGFSKPNNRFMYLTADELGAPVLTNFSNYTYTDHNTYSYSVSNSGFLIKTYDGGLINIGSLHIYPSSNNVILHGLLAFANEFAIGTNGNVYKPVDHTYAAEPIITGAFSSVILSFGVRPYRYAFTDDGGNIYIFQSAYRDTAKAAVLILQKK